MKKLFTCLSVAVLSATMLTSAEVGTASANAAWAKTQEEVKPLMVKNANPSLHFDVQFVPQFKVKITNRQTNAVTYVDLRNGKSEYIAAGIYSKEGYLLRQVRGMYDPIHNLVPLKQKNGGYLYEGRQTIWGMHNSDLLATVSSTWTVQNNQWKALDAKLIPYDRSNKPYPPIWINTAYQSREENTFILDAKQAEVNGDGKIDTVLLIGHKPGMALNLFADDLQVVTVDGETHQEILAPAGQFASGFVPSLKIGDSNGDKVMDVYVIMPNGGPDGQTVTSVLTYVKKKPADMLPLTNVQVNLVRKR